MKAMPRRRSPSSSASFATPASPCRRVAEVP
jgi:hypothetical protein